MYNRIRIAEIAECLSNVTQGQWKTEITDDGFLCVSSQVRPDDSSPFVVCSFGDMEGTEAEDHSNAEFIAEAPGYVTYLLAVVREQARQLQFVPGLDP